MIEAREWDPSTGWAIKTEGHWRFWWGGSREPIIGAVVDDGPCGDCPPCSSCEARQRAEGKESSGGEE